MHYQDPLIDESKTGNVNVSTEPPFKTFIKLSAALTLIACTAYLLLSLLVYQIVRHISFASEEKYFSSLTKNMLFAIDDQKYAQQTQALQRIADKLRNDAIAADSNHPLKDIKITLHYSDDNIVNAYALPAGHIVVMRGLLEAMPNENMLAMVIGHEIGHVVNRDSLMRLGRTTLANIMLLALFGNDGSMLNLTVMLMEGGYSREAESEADELALTLLNTSYGHAFGAAELFDVFATINPEQSRWIELSSSHPLPTNRRHAIEKIIQQRGYAVSPDKALSMPPLLKALPNTDSIDQTQCQPSDTKLIRQR